MSALKVTATAITFKVSGFYLLLLIDIFLSALIEPTFDETLAFEAEEVVFFLIIM
jgi:hypothetical protein